MVGLYNKLQRTTLPVERPLVSAKLDAAGARGSTLAIAAYSPACCTFNRLGVTVPAKFYANVLEHFNLFLDDGFLCTASAFDAC
jgi:hypothetical protein